MPLSFFDLVQEFHLRGVNLEPVDLCDAFWLTARGFVAETSRKTPPAHNESTTRARGDSSTALASQSRKGRDVAGVQHAVHALAGPAGERLPGRLVGLPTPPEISRSVELDRALRPLRKKRHLSTRTELDEEATVTAISETRVWQVITCPLEGRWLDISLLVEQSPTMRLWQDTAVEFRNLLWRACTPRSLRTLRLRWSPEGMALRTLGGRAVTAESVGGPSTNRVLLVLSDALGPGWMTGEIPSLLAKWARRHPTALVQVLPPAMWPRTSLQGLQMLPASRRCSLSSDYPRGEEHPQLPVMWLEPGPLRDYALLLAENAGNSVPAFRICPDHFRVLTPGEIESQLPFDPALLDPQTEIQPIFDRFEQFASPEARTLARHLASARLFLPIMRLVQRTLVPDAAPAQLAELFQSGILFRRDPNVRPEPHPNQIEYDFLPGLRERFHDLGGIRCSLRTRELIDRYLERRLGKGKQFTALLADAEAPSGEWSVAETPRDLVPFGYVSDFLFGRMRMLPEGPLTKSLPIILSVPILLIDVVAFSTSIRVDDQRTILDRLEQVLTKSAKLVTPDGDPRGTSTGFSTGDGYCFVFENLRASEALQCALTIQTVLKKSNEAYRDLPIRLRQVLAWGDVENIKGQFLSVAIAEAGLILRSATFTQHAEADGGPAPLAITQSFHLQLFNDLDRHTKFNPYKEISWAHFQIVDKQGQGCDAYALGPVLKGKGHSDRPKDKSTPTPGPERIGDSADREDAVVPASTTSDAPASGPAADSPPALTPPAGEPACTQCQPNTLEAVGSASSRKPALSALKVASNSGTPSVTRKKCKLSCKETDNDSLHLRNASFLANLCRKFPNTRFRILRQSVKADAEPESVDPKNFMELVAGQFINGEVVTLEVSGQLQVMAAEFFKVAWENLEGYSDNIVAAKGRLLNLIDQKFTQVSDPDLEADGTAYVSETEPTTAQDPEYRCMAIINDRLHNLSLPMIPLIAKHFGCRLQISFEVPDRGIFSFTMEASNNYDLNKRILELEIGVGARITVLTSGTNAEEAGNSVRDVLENLWQCDQWVRRRAKDFDAASTVRELLGFAREMRDLRSSEYGYVQSPFISNLLTERHVLVNAPGKSFSKSEVLAQLAAPHARSFGLEVRGLLERVQEVERKHPVVLRPGFAVAHAAMDRNPRISITFGVYPDGVAWSEDEGAVKLVAMVICARDTYGTWRDYMKRFAILFRSNPTLQAQLVAARGTAEFLALLRNAETSHVEA